MAKLNVVFSFPRRLDQPAPRFNAIALVKTAQTVDAMGFHIVSVDLKSTCVEVQATAETSCGVYCWKDAMFLVQERIENTVGHAALLESMDFDLGDGCQYDPEPWNLLAPGETNCV